MGKRMGLDVFLTVSLLLLMSYRLFGSAAHEWLGILFLGLFVWHHDMNRHFFKNIFRGRYDAARAVRLVLMMLLGVAALVAVGSGVLLSRHAVPFLALHSGLAPVAQLHVASAYGCFVLAGIHAGLHGAAALGGMRRKFSRAWPLLRLLGWALSAYGVWAFWKRDVADYLLLRAHFAFFPGDNLPLFLVDYAAMFLLFACLGRGLSAALRR